MGGACGTHGGEERSAYRVLVGKRECGRPPRRLLVDGTVI
jgi:hypothetical protein